jgi:hypothetical protein
MRTVGQASQLVDTSERALGHQEPRSISVGCRDGPHSTRQCAACVSSVLDPHRTVDTKGGQVNLNTFISIMAGWCSRCSFPVLLDASADVIGQGDSEADLIAAFQCFEWVFACVHCCPE